MKEQALVQMKNQLETIGQVCNKLIQENEMLKTMVLGDHAVIKKLPGFNDAIKKLQEENTPEKDGHDDSKPEKETKD